MNESTRRALNIVAIIVLVLGACALMLMYWFGRGDVLGAARASLKNDLRNLGVAESLYFVRHRTYTAVLTELADFHPDNAVSVVRADSTAWEASAVEHYHAQMCTFGSDAVTVKCE